MDRADHLDFSRLHLQRGEPLYRTGDRFTSLYAVRSGCFKIAITLEQEYDQVAGFSMAGEVLGLDGIAGDVHTFAALALEESTVCAIPFTKLLKLARELPSLQRQIARLISRELVREQGARVLLGTLSAQARVAGFLVNFSQRLATHGDSPSEFHLRMSRKDLGSYLGLTVETVSRTFTSFHDEGLLEVRKKFIRIKNHAGLIQVCRRGLD
jgi:CRP/FNR family transcriptional regulator